MCAFLHSLNLDKSMEENKGFLNSMSPAQVFVFGIVEGILVLCTIGFFILLTMQFGGGASANTNNRVGGTPTNQPAAVNPSAGEPTVVTVAEVTNDDHIRGNEDAEITIAEYSDFDCPFCARFHDTMNQVVDKYGDDVRWVYRHFPLESIHPRARAAAAASECAADQGSFWEYGDLLIANQGSFTDDNLKKYAADLGLNTREFNNCYDSNEKDADVTEDANDGLAAGARGTPYSVVIDQDGNTQVISGAQPFAAVDATLQGLLN